MLKLAKKYKIAVKYCKGKINGYGVNFGLKTLTENYLKNFDDWYENKDKEYDIVFCIGADPLEIKSKRIVYLCASQNQKSYDNVEKCNFVQYADKYTDVVLVRYNECFDSLKEDFKNCNIFCKNFILFDFDLKHTKNKRRKAILHLGRICKFKNSIELLTNPSRYLSDIPICSYGGNLFKIVNDEFVISEKLQKYYDSNVHVLHKTLDEEPVNNKINFYPNYSPDQLYDIASQYEYAICFYNEDFLDNVEYAMLEMINAGCYVILNDSYVHTFDSWTELPRIPSAFIISDFEHFSNTNVQNLLKTKVKEIDRKKYVKSWKKMYDNNIVLESLIRKIMPKNF